MKTAKEILDQIAQPSVEIDTAPDATKGALVRINGNRKGLEDLAEIIRATAAGLGTQRCSTMLSASGGPILSADSTSNVMIHCHSHFPNDSSD